ncbi:MAG: DUF2007 domain-containing protein [Spirochaetes bacterium]|nr:DUF2007 domain-containing protein [Spirochaetota bacterium]
MEDNQNDYSEFSTVYIPKNAGDLAFIKSILDQENIRYYVKNEQAQDLFGVGQMGSSYNTITGPIEIKVYQEDFAYTKELIAGVKGDHEIIEDSQITDDGDLEPGYDQVSPLENKKDQFSLFYVFGIIVLIFIVIYFFTLF